MKCDKLIRLLSAVVLSLGILGAGFFMGKAFYYYKASTRYITVKGLAERDIKSDLAVWEIDYREVGDNLADLNQRVQHDQEQVLAFLKQRGFTPAEMEVQPAKVDDRLANIYSQPAASGTLATGRYIVSSGIRIRSGRVALVLEATQMTGALLQSGVPIAFDTTTVNPNPSYYLTQLDAIRPEMLADATRSARLVAEQFAKDSSVKLNGVQRASQGVFQIMGRDTSTMSADWNSNQSTLGSIDKKVRLVTTIDYRIK